MSKETQDKELIKAKLIESCKYMSSEYQQEGYVVLGIKLV